MKHKKRKDKGFTLTELLVVIVIVGILSSIAVVATTKYIDNAKKEIDNQNEETIVEAAKSYLESNPTKKPKSIGESLKIDLYTLRKNNYLKEDVKNSKNESCMPNSYIYVYKNDYDKYSYKGILYCGNDKIKPEKDIPRPTITDFVFADKEDVSKASFSMTIHGSDDDSVGIESYNYLIEVYKNKSKDQAEVYNSGSLSGRNQKTITVNNTLISDHIKRTDYTEVKVIVLVRNTLGGVYELTKTAEFEDTLKPICGNIINEAKEDEWYNKKDVLKDKKIRQIIVNCSDGNGSGCVRNAFSKTWPGSTIQSVEYSTIEIKDNKGKKNDCKVRVNIDVVAPTIKVTAYDGKNAVATTKTATDGETKTIDKNSYKGNHDGWLNGINYPEGVKYKVEVSDETRLSKYTWETSSTDSSSGNILDKENNQTKSSVFYIYLKDQGKRSGKLTVYDIAGNKTEMIINAYIDYTNPICTNDVTCTGGGDCSRWLGIGKSLTIKTLCEDKGGSNCAINTGGSFKYDNNIKTTKGGAGGNNKPVDVYDNAGNKGTCPANVTVKVDHETPKLSETKIYQWKENNDSSRPTTSTVRDLTEYVGGICNDLFDATNPSCSNNSAISWSRKRLFTMVTATDNFTKTENIFYQYIAKEATTNNIVNDSSRSIESDGISCIQYKACDEAGNCTKNLAKTVKIDKNAPKFTCKFNLEKGITIEPEPLTDGSGSGINTSSLRFVASMADEADEIKASWQTSNSVIIQKINSTSKCGNYTLKGWAKVKDNSGLETVVKCDGEITQPKCCEETVKYNCTDWKWSKCTKSCGGGTRYQYQKCYYKSAYDGSHCSGPKENRAYEGSECNTQSCNPDWNCFYAGTEVLTVPTWCNCTLHGVYTCHTRALRHYCYDKNSGNTINCFATPKKCPDGFQFMNVCPENPYINTWGRIDDEE